MCQNLAIEDELWMCDMCIEERSEDRDARLCKECYEYGKANADMLMRSSWSWGDDIEPYADVAKEAFLKSLEEIKPLSPPHAIKKTERDKHDR